VLGVPETKMVQGDDEEVASSGNACARKRPREPEGSPESRDVDAAESLKTQQKWKYCVYGGSPPTQPMKMVPSAAGEQGMVSVCAWTGN
jgi:hypothetical protein